MTMLADFLPGFKRFFKSIPLADTTKRLASSVIVAFLMHIGRMSCLQAAGAVRCDARHRAQISRFLKRPRWRGKDINAMLRQNLLDMETGSGPFIFVDRRHVVCPCRSEDEKYVQHRQPQAATAEEQAV